MVDVLGLLAVGGDVAADGGEAIGSLVAAELAADLGLELDHAQVALGRVVIERQGEVAGVGEEEVAMLGQRYGEVAGVLVRPVQLAAGHRWERGTGGLAAQLVPPFADFVVAGRR